MNLGFLDLSFNFLRQIELDAFKGLTKLTVMWLNNNFLIVNSICGNVFKNVKAIQNLRLNYNKYTTVTKIYGEIVQNLPELYRLELDVVIDYEFEIEFAYLKNLSTLIIHSKSLDGFYFRKRTFKHLPLTQITELQLHSIYRIDNDSFSNLTGIQTLFISMGNNYHQETIIRTFQSLDAFRETNMTQLAIHGSNIETSFVLDGSMLQYVQRICLKHFTLSSMYISDIDAQALRTFANYSKCLESLEISDNIMYDPTLIVSFAICYFRNLRSFKYSDNNQRIGHMKDETPYVKYDVNNTDMNTIQMPGYNVKVCIPKTLTTLFLRDSPQSKTTFDGFSFAGGKNLQKLSFLLRLDGCSFQINGVENLKYLDMTGWYCNKVSGHLLSNLPLLETLIASDVHLGDGLKNHSEAAFLLQNNLNLTYIDFSYNVISNLPKSLFMHRLAALTELNLSHNNLSTFPSFASEIQLEILDLSFNSIIYFSDDEIQTIDNMKPFKIYLKGNPLQCLCPSLRFLNWMKQSHIVADVDVLRCVQEDGSSQNIVNITRNLKLYESECLSKFWFPFSVTLSSVLILCIVFTVVYFRYTRAFGYFFLLMKMRPRRHKPSPNRREFDAYISYSHNDITWVKEFHDNLESMGFNLCLDEKSFIAGNPVGENIIQAIDSSRKVIFIITKNFLNSDWGSYELEMTRMHAFQRDSDNMVIVVIKDDIPMERIPHVLQSMWFKITFVKWPKESSLSYETEEHFYKMLRISISH
jgi:Leucine-rich repeat (LRR) protein